MLIACWTGNKATKELYSTSTMPGKILSKFNEENAWFLPQFFVVQRYFFQFITPLICSNLYNFALRFSTLSSLHLMILLLL